MSEKRVPNSRHLEVLSMSVHKSPLALKHHGGSSRTYIRPLQKDLDLTPLSDDEDVVCIKKFFNLCNKCYVNAQGITLNIYFAYTTSMFHCISLLRVV